ncbi:hypothetical protein [Nocardiopsis halophila]|uniref:hypothetical protein n=1 Tax=Nocardiopsis halophila TaxID=141692 RepID=UPI00034729EB|nr:hypothetical protein [Nocardiopsis halophila]
MRTLLRRTGTALAVAAAGGMLATGCSLLDATDAHPESTAFPFDGDVLDVVAGGTPTDLVEADREDVGVTRWIATRGDPDVTSSWSLEDGTLRLDNSCSGICVYDDRFRVEVPAGVRVLRDGEPTDLEGD